MTRPLFEPSTPRQVAGLSWGEDQLYRRPPIPPTSSAPQYALLSCTTQPTIVSPNDPIPWDVFYTTDQTIFDVVGGTGGTNLTCYGTGAYVFEAKVKFFDVGASVAAIISSATLFQPDGDPDWFAFNNWITNTAPSGVEEIGIRDLATAYMNAADAPGDVFVFCWDMDAINHDISIAYLKAMFWPATNDLTQIF